MGRDVKIGVNRGDEVPPFKWSVVEQVHELAREIDPTHPVTQRVSKIENFFELKEKGGPLGKINIRVFFVIDKRHSAIVILGPSSNKTREQLRLAIKSACSGGVENILTETMAYQKSEVALGGKSKGKEQATHRRGERSRVHETRRIDKNR